MKFSQIKEHTYSNYLNDQMRDCFATQVIYRRLFRYNRAVESIYMHVCIDAVSPVHREKLMGRHILVTSAYRVCIDTV